MEPSGTSLLGSPAQGVWDDYQFLQILGQDLFFYRYNARGDFTYVSPSVRAILGYEPDDFQANYPSLRMDVKFPLPAARLSELAERGTFATRLGTDFYHKDGSRRSLELHESPIRGPDGALLEVAGMARDVTEHRRAETEMRRDRAMLESAHRVARLGYWIWDIASGETIWSDEMYRIYHRPREQGPITMEWKECLLADDRPRVEQAIGSAIASGEPCRLDYRIHRADGEICHLHVDVEVEPDAAGRPARVIGTAFDITERKRMEDSLLESEGKYHVLFETAADAILLMEADVITDCNHKATELFRSNRNQLLGLSCLRLSPAHQPNGRASTEDLLRKLSMALEGLQFSFEWRHLSLDGAEFDAEVSLSCFETRDRKYILALVRDVSERKHAEREREELARLPAESPHPVLRVSDAGVLLYANAAARDHLDCLGMAAGGRVSGPLAALAEEARRWGTRRQAEVTCDGHVFSVTASPVRAHGYVNFYGMEITEQKQVEEELRRSKEEYRRLTSQAEPVTAH